MPDPIDATMLPDGFDLEALLAPIPGDAPQGIDLRQDFSAQSPYFRLRDARSEAREAERRSETGGADEVTPPQWRTVAEIAATALRERSKDLEIAAWLTESLVRSSGLRGLTAGAALLRGLAEAFWDDVFPLPDEDGMVTRVLPITGLNGQDADGTLMQALRRLPFFLQPDGASFGWYQFEQSIELSGIADETRRQQRLAAGVLPFEETEKLARAAGAAHWRRQQSLLEAALGVWRGMGEALDGLAGADGPSTGRITNLLVAMLEAVARFAPAPEAEAVADGAAPEAGGAAAAASGGVAAPRPGMGREEMLRQLAEIAAFFRRTEPNSPLAYTLEDAVRRARMPLPELLAEVVTDEATRSALLTTLGIRVPPPE